MIAPSNEFCGFPLNDVQQGVSACMGGRVTVKSGDESCVGFRRKTGIKNVIFPVCILYLYLYLYLCSITIKFVKV